MFLKYFSNDSIETFKLSVNTHSNVMITSTSFASLVGSGVGGEDSKGFMPGSGIQWKVGSFGLSLGLLIGLPVGVMVGSEVQ